MSKSKSPTEWLNPILDDFFAASTGIEPKGIPEHARTNARQAIQAHTEDYARKAVEADRKLRLEPKQEFTKKWLAKQLGISRPTLDEWLKDSDKFTIGAVKKLASLDDATQRKQLDERIGKSEALSSAASFRAYR